MASIEKSKEEEAQRFALPSGLGRRRTAVRVLRKTDWYSPGLSPPFRSPERVHRDLCGEDPRNLRVDEKSALQRRLPRLFELPSDREVAENVCVLSSRKHVPARTFLRGVPSPGSAGKSRRVRPRSVGSGDDKSRTKTNRADEHHRTENEGSAEDNRPGLVILRSAV